MRRFLTLLGLCLFFTLSNAAYYKNKPYKITQPNGDIIECFVSGDEFFNFIHDANNYTIIQNNDGYFCYALSDSKGNIYASRYVVGTTNPLNTELKTNVIIKKEEYRRRAVLNKPEHKSSRAPHEGTLNNIVIFIQFADDGEFENDLPRSEFNIKFNAETGKSVKTYYQDVSYGKLEIKSTYYPSCDFSTNIYHTDSHNRNYYKPYNEASNPDGYSGDSERMRREQALLKDAINALQPEIENALTKDQIDIDNDGLVDNVTFVIRGDNGAWSQLLWAHRSILTYENVYIHGKRVYDYTFQPVSQNELKTLCHELFHALGAPDLYHYSQDGYESVGDWSLMHSGFVHMSAYEKWKYAGQKWVKEIPEITVDGKYTLYPLSHDGQNCFKLKSPNSESEQFIIEYRKRTGEYESVIPSEGIVIYRVNESLNGNAQGPPDEIYVYRKNGTTTSNGTINMASFSSDAQRIEFNDNTNPSCFLSDGSAGGIRILDISEIGETMTFRVKFDDVEPVKAFNGELLTNTSIKLNWTENASQNNVLIAWSTSPTFGTPGLNNVFLPGKELEAGGTILYAGDFNSEFIHANIDPETKYYYKAWSYNHRSISEGVSISLNTPVQNIINLPFTEDFANGLPAGWTITDNEQNNEIWEYGNLNNIDPGFSTTENGYFYLSSDQYGAGHKQNSDLITSTFDLSAYQTVELNFEHYYKHVGSCKATFAYSTNGGTSWTDVKSWSSSTASPELFNTDLSTALNGQQNVKFKWNFTGSYGYYWLMDDINITGTYKDSYLALSNQIVYAEKSAGEFNVSVQSNVNWTANSDATWFTITESGSGNESLNISYTAQESTQERSATITVSTTGMADKTITVKQAGFVSGNDIYSFSFEDQSLETLINSTDKTISLEVSHQADITNLVAWYQISNGAKAYIGEVLQINGGSANDFTTNIAYSIIGEDGAEAIWTIHVTQEEAPSTENNIVSFTLEEQYYPANINIENHTVHIQVVEGTDLTNLTPVIEVSEGATINPASGISLDFTADRIYTVTAANEDKQEWTVSVNIYTGINEITNSDIKIYPNPASEVVNIMFPKKQYEWISIYNLQGQLIKKIKIQNHENHKSFSVNNLISGYYIINMQGSGISNSDHFFIQ